MKRFYISHRIFLIYHSKSPKDFHWYPTLSFSSTPSWSGIDVSWCGFYMELGKWH